MNKAVRKMVAGARGIVEPYAHLTDEELEAAAQDCGDEGCPVAKELARLVISMRFALREFDAAAKRAYARTASRTGR